VTSLDVSPEIMIHAQNVTVAYQVAHYKVQSLKEFLIRRLRGYRDSQPFLALDDVSVSVAKGESVAFVGHNGSGKSTLLKVIAGIIEPPGATVQVTGRIAPMIELGAGFDGELSGRANIRLSCMLMGLTAREIDERIDRIIEFSEIRDHMDVPLKNYSSGMQARLGFACATSVDPDVLLVDEVLSVGDTNFARKCLTRIEALRERGTTVVLVSHDEATVKRFCSRAYVLDSGRVVAQGPVDEALAAHRALMDEKYLLTLSEAERGAFERKRALEKNDSARSQSSLPIVNLDASVLQDGQRTVELDFAQAFELRAELSCPNPELIQERLSFGFGLNLLTGQRVGGFNNFHRDVTIPVEPLKSGKVTVVFSFAHGLPQLCSGEFELVVGVHDSDLRRTLHFGHLCVLSARNSRMGLNVDGDIFALQTALTNVEVRI
jgi:ABC-type polysaccharide/polyol phosphate transport system ATPase subunit